MAIDQVNTWLGAVVSLGLALIGLGRDEPRDRPNRRQPRVGPMFLIWSPLPYRFGFNRPSPRRSCGSDCRSRARA